jgi:hypothetical protein
MKFLFTALTSPLGALEACYMCPQGDVRVYQAVELVGMHQKVVRRYLPGDDSDACASCAVAY